MPEISAIKTGSKIEVAGVPYKVLKATFSKIGRQGAVLRSRLMNLESGQVSEKTFHDSDKVDEPEMSSKKAQFLYADGEEYHFMDEETFEQFALSKSVLGELTNFLKEGCSAAILYHKNKPINLELPIKLEFQVIEAPPSIRGNTADGGNKKVKIETGLELNVPLFIEKGDTILINTEEGTYVERVK